MGNVVEGSTDVEEEGGSKFASVPCMDDPFNKGVHDHVRRSTSSASEVGVE